MAVSLCLAELIGFDGNPQKRPGIISQISQHTKLERHLVADLLHNRVKSVSLAALDRLGSYLAEVHGIERRLLPGLLFRSQPDGLWPLLAEQARTELCVGVRPRAGQALALPSTADALLASAVSMVLDRHRRSQDAAPRTSPTFLPSGRQHAGKAHARSLAWDVYNRFWGSDDSRHAALVCVGGPQENPVAEIVLAKTFGTVPFKSQDGVENSSGRRVPFFFRHAGPKGPASCCGGERLSMAEDSPEPGIYFESSSGAWNVCPWLEGSLDAALVFYAYHPAASRLELVLSGFSPRAARSLAGALELVAAQLWPPVWKSESQWIGAFVVAFEYAAPTPKRPPSSSAKVIPLTESAIKTRMARRRTRTGSKV